MSRVEQIGRATLLRLALHNHVATLAETDEVAQDVCDRGCSETAKRRLVVDGDTVPDVLVATLASAFVSGNGSFPGLQPTFAAVGRNSPNIVRGVRACFPLAFVCGVARFSAKAKTRLRLVLAFNPRLDPELDATLRADMTGAFRLVGRGVAYREGVGRSPSLPPLVPELVFIRHRPNGHVPTSTALLRAKTRLHRSIRLHLKRLSADFAGNFNHLLSIAGTTGVANIGAAA